MWGIIKDLNNDGAQPDGCLVSSPQLGSEHVVGFISELFNPMAGVWSFNLSTLKAEAEGCLQFLVSLDSRARFLLKGRENVFVLFFIDLFWVYSQAFHLGVPALRALERLVSCYAPTREGSVGTAGRWGGMQTGCPNTGVFAAQGCLPKMHACMSTCRDTHAHAHTHKYAYIFCSHPSSSSKQTSSARALAGLPCPALRLIYRPTE